MSSGFLESLKTRIGIQKKTWGGRKKPMPSPETGQQKKKNTATAGKAVDRHTEEKPRETVKEKVTEEKPRETVKEKVTEEKPQDAVKRKETAEEMPQETVKEEITSEKLKEVSELNKESETVPDAGTEESGKEFSKGESKTEMEEKKSTDFFGGEHEEEQDVLFEEEELSESSLEDLTDEVEARVKEEGAEEETVEAAEEEPVAEKTEETAEEETAAEETEEVAEEESAAEEPEKPEEEESIMSVAEKTEETAEEETAAEETEEVAEEESAAEEPEKPEGEESIKSVAEETEEIAEEEFAVEETEKVAAEEPAAEEPEKPEEEEPIKSVAEQPEENVENPDRPMLYENRELSWLKFNERVLEEAVSPRNPLCEKMSFLSIFQSNLDEFFMVRVGSLQDQGLLSHEIRDNKTNMTCEEQIDAILARVRELTIRKDEVYANIMSEVAEHGITLRSFADLPKSKDKSLEAYFMKEISPLLTAMLVGRKQPFPFLRSQEIYALAVLETKNEKKKLGIIPCTSHVFPRLIPVSSKPGVYVLSEELILRYIHKMYKGYRVLGKTLIRITRNADIDTDTVYDEDLGYRDYMAQIVKQRRKLAPIRLELTNEVEPGALATVCQYFDLDPNRVFFSKAPLDLSFLSQISGELRQDTSLVYPRRKPQQSRMVEPGCSMIAQILERDILLTYPFESIRPFLNLLNEAARDPKVISIRMTLYRLAKNSKVIEALVEAAENGKQVDVLVELKARFDEENNIGWSRTLEDAGCHVVYGIDGLKVHSKLCLITRKDGPDIQYITQIGTGNYNESTSKVYTDLSLMTANTGIGEEASQIFHSILLGEVTEESEHLLVAPLCMKNRVLAMMEEEIRLAKAGKPAYIGVKINSLTDKKIIDKLIDASRAGVKIDMVVRGICCLKSGVPGWTDNIRVMSIVGRFLEHSRIYIFGTPDRDRIYISSADFMTRNMSRRVEIAAPIYDETLKSRLRTMFDTMLHDTANGRVQRPDGTYVHCEPAENENPVNSQEQFYTEAYAAAEA